MRFLLLLFPEVLYSAHALPLPGSASPVRSPAHPATPDYESFIFALDSICTLYPHTLFFKGYSKPVKVDFFSLPAFLLCKRELRWRKNIKTLREDLKLSPLALSPKPTVFLHQAEPSHHPQSGICEAGLQV